MNCAAISNPLSEHNNVRTTARYLSHRASQKLYQQKSSFWRPGTNAGSLCSYTKSVLSVHSDKVLKRIPFAEERMTKLPIYYDVRQGKGAEQ